MVTKYDVLENPLFSSMIFPAINLHWCWGFSHSFPISSHGFLGDSPAMFHQQGASPSSQSPIISLLNIIKPYQWRFSPFFVDMAVCQNLVPLLINQNSWVKMDVHPIKNGINRYWSIAISLLLQPAESSQKTSALSGKPGAAATAACPRWQTLMGLGLFHCPWGMFNGTIMGL